MHDAAEPKEQRKRGLADKSRRSQTLEQTEAEWLEACEALESAEQTSNNP